MRNKALRLAACEAGVSKFIAVCPHHGERMHYTSSGRCMQCAAEAKDPAKQARYWGASADTINAARRAAYRGI